MRVEVEQSRRGQTAATGRPGRKRTAEPPTWSQESSNCRDRWPARTASGADVAIPSRNWEWMAGQSNSRARQEPRANERTPAHQGRITAAGQLHNRCGDEPRRGDHPRGIPDRANLRRGPEAALKTRASPATENHGPSRGDAGEHGLRTPCNHGRIPTALPSLRWGSLSKVAGGNSEDPARPPRTGATPCR